MNSLTRIEINIVFPYGAHFFKNVNLIIYKQLISFIHRLNCLAPKEKCYLCPLNKECRYYYYTGENFSKYSSILIHNDFFPKSIYQKNEEVKFIIYLIGSGSILYNYIKIFFEEYLNHKLVNNYFYIENIEKQVLTYEKSNTKSLKVLTPLKSKNVIENCNDMIDYYNTHYDMNLSKLDESVFTSSNYMQKSLFESVILATRKINIQGYVGQIDFNRIISIPNIFYEIGIGTTNCVGGGYIEN